MHIDRLKPSEYRHVGHRFRRRFQPGTRLGGEALERKRRTPLMIAALHGRRASANACKKSICRCALLDLLLGWLWDIDPLVNCHVHSLDVLSFLLGVGADVNVRSDDDDWCV